MIPDLEDVVTRLQRNNPRLDPELARSIAPHLTRTTQAGLRWAFDSRASSVFIGTTEEVNELFWSQIQAPTCVISGALSYEYWGSEMSGPDFDGRFAEGEMEQRAAIIPNHEHHWFDRSGHMVHYDEPDRLGQMCRSFLENLNV